MELSKNKLIEIKSFIQKQAAEAGFQDTRVSNTETSGYFEKYQSWITNARHGEMSYLERNQNLRQYPDQLHPGTCRVISLRYNYLPRDAQFCTPLSDNNLANISRYALGRDYHKLIRKKLSRLCTQLVEHFKQDEQIDFRVFVDSAPVLESSFAEKSGIGWKGKHTLVINQDAGSWFFLSEIFINVPLAIDTPVENQCGSCNACIKLCPTQAIIAPNLVDATRCISYLTIENKQAIPVALRKKLGNRIYGCDDCQLACPWNRFSQITQDADFQPREKLDNISLLALWQWSEEEFSEKLQGNPIRRIGYQSWLRNLAVAIGNSNFHQDKIFALESKKNVANDMVVEHINWAINNLKTNSHEKSTTSQKTLKLINCIKNMLPRDA